MRFFSWLRNFTPGGERLRPARIGPRTCRRRPVAGYRPRVECLEDRSMPSTLTVLNGADTGAGSLRDTIAAAQSGDMINFAPSLYGQSITLTSGELTVDKSLDIEGPGGSNGPLRINGNFSSRVFDITNSSATVVVDNLDI